MRGILLALILLCCAPPLTAAPLRGVAAQPVAGSLQRVAERRISEDQAARIAQRAVGGRVLAAESGEIGGRPVVRVKLLTREGVVRVVIVDATTGQVQ